MSTDANIAQFCAVTGASHRDAKRFLDKYKKLDVAIDAFFDNPTPPPPTSKANSSTQPSTSKLHVLFDRYKDPDEQDITAEGTIKFCADLDVNPEDVVLLAVAYELKSTRLAEWNKKGWTEGWKGLGCDSIPAMKAVLPRLRDKLGSDRAYFRKVYLHAFDFARAEGQRSLPIDSAQAFWALLLPHGLSGGALSHTHSPLSITSSSGSGSSSISNFGSPSRDRDGDVSMASGSPGEGWQEEHTTWWFEFLSEKKVKGVSKDTWSMFMDFITSVDSKFETYNTEEAWPTLIDDFVEWVRKRIHVPKPEGKNSFS
ncbi:hypothetical protein E1B28_013712 [Marasmius oreades]|uniref:Defective in cullin neddylation protein n=1 Tax=Marasmius oreades TaxID=181124 RepID=A0A9P7RR68_9AGAR|nr:uncharacterized protein E1B28_013712 [Marasmius oreades]KAG7087771.1 hypothetical protein E1B28_013712 [Marasmius oreades]